MAKSFNSLMGVIERGITLFEGPALADLMSGISEEQKFAALLKLRLDDPSVYDHAISRLNRADAKVLVEYIAECDRTKTTPTISGLNDWEISKKKSFATLADDFRAALVDTSRMGFPLEVLEPDVRARADSACRALIPRLHQAHRIVLEPDFTELAAKVAMGPPLDLARYLDLARLPFDHIWLEWPQPVRRAATVGTNYAKDEQIPPRVGVLIWPVEAPGEGKTYHLICVQGYPDTCAASPIGMVFSFTQDMNEFSSWQRLRYEDSENPDPSAQREIDEAPIGFHYMHKVREDNPDQVSLAEGIARRAWMTISPPFGPLHAETIIDAQETGRPEVAERQQQWLGLNTRENNGLWRWLIAVFGLYNTGGGEFVFSDNRRQKSQMYDRGKRSLPAYEYRVLKLRRPTSPEIVQKRLPSTSTLGRRLHSVPGSWHHRRLATAECARHPKACPIARWEYVYDDDGNRIGPEGHEQQKCGVCSRLKWWMPDHERGDKALGIVDKGYRISATGQARSHETQEVIEAFPRGVKVKTIPRFQVLSGNREDKSNEQHPRGRGNPGS